MPRSGTWIDDVEALAVLDDALHHCGTENMRTPAVVTAPAELGLGAAEAWPFAQFRHALDASIDQPAADGRQQLLNASLNAIRRVCRR